MSNSITKIDSKLVGEMEPVTLQDAQLAMTGADMRDDEMLTRVRDRAVIGRFIAGQIGGYIVGEAEAYLQSLSKARKSLEKVFDNDKSATAEKVSASEALKNISNAAAAQFIVQLKGAELLAVGGKKKERKSNAPTNILGTAIYADNVQVNGGSSSEKAA